MEYFERNPASAPSEVGAKAEARLLPLAPLIEYYEREMGEFSGRLMIATNFLEDAQLMPGWKSQAEEIRQAVEQAQALVVSVMFRLMKQQAQAKKGENGPSLEVEIQQFLDSLPNYE